MRYSRLRRSQDRKIITKVWISVAISAAIILIVFIFGIPILINFGVVVDTIRGKTEKPEPTITEEVLLAPVFDPTFEATNTANINLSGTADPEKTVIIYVNDVMRDEVMADSEGRFEVKKLPLKKGENAISAKTKTGEDKFSNLSKIIYVTLETEAPQIELDNPAENTTIRDSSVILVSGKTDPENSLEINGRYVVVRSDGLFSYSYPLTNGENNITVKAINQAGIETQIERKVRYEP